MELKNIVYSHSDYFDVLEIFLEQQKKFGIDNVQIFSNKKYNDLNEHVIYEDSLTYSEKLEQCLLQINDEYVLYQHEDMFLYSKPNLEKLDEYVKVLSGTDYSFVRLIKTGTCFLNPSTSSETLHDISIGSPDFFAVQPTIWKRKDFIKFLQESGKVSIWELEGNSGKINYTVKGALHYDNENSRGGHFDSNVWPYVATAIVKGAWNFKEYKKELSEVKKILTSKREMYT